MSGKPDTYICPNCGVEVPIGPRGCPKCNPEREEQPAEVDSVHDGLDLPGEDDFDYDQFVADEFGGPQPQKSRKDLFWWIAAIITLIAFTWVAIVYF